MIYDSIKTGAAALPQFKAAFDFMSTLSENTPIGRIEISEDMYCNVMEYDADKAWGPCPLEAHKSYIDIQLVLKGSEAMACRNISGLSVETPYKEEKDVLFYQGKSEGTMRLELYPGMFAVFFPNDGHNGKFEPISGANKIRKAVIKVRIR